MANKISGVIITLNEEKNIERCIASLKGVVDEIVVVDSFSTDRTKEICLENDVQFFEKEWVGYSEAKNFGMSKAKGDFILSIDADEVLSTELKNGIIQKKDHLDGIYSFNRLTNYCGKWIRHSGWYPDKKIRIFPKDEAHWNENPIHEKILFKKSLPEHFIEGDLLHYSIVSIEDHLKKINYYTNIEAHEAFKAGEIVSNVNWLFSPIFKFIKIYFFHKGFLDGFHGFLIASFSAFSKFLKYSKLKQIHFFNK